MEMTMNETHRFVVEGMACEHCRSSVSAAVQQLAGVETVEVDLASKDVTVSGSGLDDAAIRAAIVNAGYDVARA
jgi:copper chaperone